MTLNVLVGNLKLWKLARDKHSSALIEHKISYSVPFSDKAVVTWSELSPGIEKLVIYHDGLKTTAALNQPVKQKDHLEYRGSKAMSP